MPRMHASYRGSAREDGGEVRRVKIPVPLPLARKRALTFLALQPRGQPSKANSIGYCIWPNVSMTSQGMAGAAGRIISGLKRDDLVEWTRTATDWGWRITVEGRAYLREHWND